MPPFTDDYSAYDDSDIAGYRIKKDGVQFLPTLIFKDGDVMCPNVHENTNDCWDCLSSLDNDECDWTFGIEEAREAAWENFEHNYIHDMVRVV